LDYTKNTARKTIIATQYGEGTYLEEQLEDYKTIARELKSVNQQIRNTTFKINNLNRHLGD
jgi:ribosomal protein S15P/S13E